MEFGIDKCAVLVMKKGEVVMVNEMKDKVKKEYYKRARKVFETKLRSGNVWKALNTWAVSVVIFCSIPRVVKTSTRGD